MSGPKIPWRPGRIDGLAKDATPDGRLPDASQGSDHLRNVSIRSVIEESKLTQLCPLTDLLPHGVRVLGCKTRSVLLLLIFGSISASMTRKLSLLLALTRWDAATPTGKSLCYSCTTGTYIMGLLAPDIPVLGHSHPPRLPITTSPYFSTRSMPFWVSATSSLY
jgi:hypothetical protein